MDLNTVAFYFLLSLLFIGGALVVTIFMHAGRVVLAFLSGLVVIVVTTVLWVRSLG